jgi:hypothetical protein
MVSQTKSDIAPLSRREWTLASECGKEYNGVPQDYGFMLKFKLHG